ncbi:MAG TPA: phytanoyl-CoA dioxygenase family protein [Burkholderiales bacterium]|jgi:ectoine hydroxylase|nr:phytanoyl-CoA dioxygenase family protein [Burkholderiales bacterium]
MRLTPDQVAQYERDGFLIFPGLFSRAEVAVLRQETARLSQIRSETVIREHTGAVRSIFRVHEEDGDTRSPAFRALVRTPRVLEPVRAALGTDEVYVYHTKINTKPAIEGTVWMWHQDYGSWMRDGCARPDMGTFAVMLTDSSEMNGALYVIPGSHKRGRIEPYFDDRTSYKFWAVPKEKIVDVLQSSPPPVAVTGPAGTAMVFHCNLLHASGHNLSAEDRWHIYLSFNACANAPRITAQSRGDWVVSRNTKPLPIEDDGAIVKAA